MRERMILLPETGSGAMQHCVLEGLRPAVLLVVQSALNGRVKASGQKIGLKARVDWRRIVLIKPRIQLLDFTRRERADGAFNLLDGVQAHGTNLILPALWRFTVGRLTARAVPGAHAGGGL